ncbi:hypothetical protein BJ875DRAFT_521889 [Amylocarpus encephaloides]|uniref:AB hydrolase-1 domain-containing protein n=1 Tax=Amylocarpus encephaloides TaxID=45428 RepID=A0A9P7YAF9_9HELO|nr:hypothetical protein BJ875DRAFT_521889 [Amylocarpus encephaloides]
MLSFKAITLSTCALFILPTHALPSNVEPFPTISTKPDCKDVTFTLGASARTLGLWPWSVDTLLSTPLTTLFANGSALNYNFPISQTVNVTGGYCEPANGAHSRGTMTIEILFKSWSMALAIQMHVNWAGNGFSGIGRDGQDESSWVDYAVGMGHPTLTINRLERGKSSRIDPKEMQFPLEVELVHQIIGQASAGMSPLRNLKFDKIIYTGHAYGSIIGNNLVVRYPADVDALGKETFPSWFISTLTYNLNLFDSNPINKFVGPAKDIVPERFASYEQGWTTFLDIVTLQQFFYTPKIFDPRALQEDFKNRGVISIGEIATATAGPRAAFGFTGPVLIATGKDDLLFCGTGPLGSRADCGNATSGQVANTRDIFPRSRNFEAYVVPNAGSAWLNHYVAREGIQHVHAWLREVGL